MKSFKILSSNLINPIISKIVKPENHECCLYASNSVDLKTNESIDCKIYNEVPSEQKDDCFIQINGGNNLNIDDIIIVDTSGTATTLIDSQSDSNSLFLTNKCNCNCIMCPQPPKNDDDNHVSIALKIIDLISTNHSYLGITGGEPTLKWGELLQIIDKCNQKIPDTYLQILTNGRLLKDYDKTKKLYELSKKLYFCIPLYSDIYSIHDKIVRADGAFYETINGLYNLAKHDFPIELRIVINKINYKRLPEWAEFIYRNLPFVQNIALMALEPVGLALKNLNEVWVDPVEYGDILLKTALILNQRNMNFSIFNHQLCTIPKPLWKYSVKSISEWKNVFLKKCSRCVIKNDCGGFFYSLENIYSEGIKPIDVLNKEQICQINLKKSG